MATVQKDNPGYKGAITPGDQKRAGGNGIDRNALPFENRKRWGSLQT